MLPRDPPPGRGAFFVLSILVVWMIYSFSRNVQHIGLVCILSGSVVFLVLLVWEECECRFGMFKLTGSGGLCYIDRHLSLSSFPKICTDYV